MTVEQLISALEKLPPDAEVGTFRWTGNGRTTKFFALDYVAVETSAAVKSVEVVVGVGFSGKALDVTPIVS